MFDRTCTVAVSSLIAAALLLVVASVAGAQATQAAAAAKPTRHVDVGAGVGAHWGTSKGTPIDDDFYANIGLAKPFTNRVDGEFQFGYWTAGDYDGDDPPGANQGGRTGCYLYGGARLYFNDDPGAVTRVYFAAGPSMITNFKDSGGVTPSVTLGPGIRLMLGAHSGLVARVPVEIMVKGDPYPLFLPTLNYMYQF
jgi:hypothetical protein